jgi:hypothetical protein
MVSSLDIFGLTLGLFYAVFTPLAAYLLCRIPLALKLRDVALGAFGYFAAYGLHRTIARPALSALFDVLGRAHYDLDPRAIIIFYNWLLQSAPAVQGALICFVLLSLLASRKQGLGPGMGYAIGAGGAYCLAIRAHVAYQHLQWALASNENGPESVFRSGANSPEFLNRMFAYGIPYGAGSVPHFLIAIAVSLLIWKGVLERRWAPAVAAILIEVVQAALFVFVESIPSRTSSNTFDSLISRDTYDSALGLIIVALLYWRAPILNGLRSVSGVGSDREAGLLSVWRDQAWRNRRD